MMKAPLPTKAFQRKVQAGWVPAPRCVSERATCFETVTSVADLESRDTKVRAVLGAVRNFRVADESGPRQSSGEPVLREAHPRSETRCHRRVGKS